MTSAVALHDGQPLGHPVEVGGAGPDRLAQVGRRHEGLVEVGLLGEEAEGQVALAMDLAEVRLVATGGQPEQRRLAGAVRPDQPDPVAERDRGVDGVEDDEGADLAGHAGQAQDAHRAWTGGLGRGRCARRRPAGRGGPLRSLGPCPRRRPVGFAGRQPDRPLPRQLGPATSGPTRAAGHRPQDGRRALAVGRAQPLAPRAEMRGTRADDDPLDRPSTARAGLAGPLVDLQALLHRAIAVGRRVVVDRAPATLDGLGQHGPDRVVQPSFVGRPERPGGPQRMEPRRPQRLVGVDVADAGQERLVEQQRLEPAGSPPDQAPEVTHGEGRIERLRSERREDRRPADLGDQVAAQRVAAVQPDPAELADVAEPELPAVGQLEDQPDIRVLRAVRPGRRTAGRSS